MATYRRIDTVEKACKILKYLGTVKQPVTGSDIGAAVGLPPGTVMCHLATLEDAGFVRQIGEGWEIGMGMALLYYRVKSGLEADRDRISRDLERIGGVS